MREDFSKDLVGTSYRYVRHLGKGGMGDVIVVRREGAPESGSDDRVMKLIRSDRGIHKANWEQRLHGEARMLANFDHPNLVRVLDYGITPTGRAFLVSELLQGETLTDVVAKGPLEPATALDITAQLLEGLRAVHARGLVHRDIKPDNLFLTHAEPRVLKILDFGIARVIDPDMKQQIGTPATQEGFVMGTPRYFSPEQAQGKPADARSDLYSVGGTLYFLLTGAAPFVSNGDPAFYFVAHVAELPTPPSQRRKGISPNLDALVMRALAKRASHRYATAEEMLEAILALRPPKSFISTDALLRSILREGSPAPAPATMTSRGTEVIEADTDPEVASLPRTPHGTVISNDAPAKDLAIDPKRAEPLAASAQRTIDEPRPRLDISPTEMDPGSTPHAPKRSRSLVLGAALLGIAVMLLLVVSGALR